MKKKKKQRKKPSVIFGLVTFVLVTTALVLLIDNFKNIIVEFVSPLWQTIIASVILLVAIFTGVRTFK